ncbi:alpha/beta hydrolase [Luteococcus sp. OSA5]|uniref:alpha/beta hydrolase n=1 Tax=Luteococcus sp. OSA5 TaxID=3401630 RepID=UPI003B42B0DB
MNNPVERVRANHRARALVAPELRRGLRSLPALPPLQELVARLPGSSRRVAGLEAGVRHQLVTIDGPGGALELHLYRPRQHRTGALVWLHGGGRVAGSARHDHQVASELAAGAGVLVVSVEYRLAPQHPYPAALDDAWTALNWLYDHQEELAISRDRIAVGGASAGGGLAAELAQRARDLGLPVAFQLLVYPMLDDRTTGAHEPLKGASVWSSEKNLQAWRDYLGHPAGEAEDRPWAVAARCPDFRGLPPAWIGVGDLDLFLDESLAYARELEQAHVPCEVHLVPGMFHGADDLPGRRGPLMSDFRTRMARAVHDHIG